MALERRQAALSLPLLAGIALPAVPLFGLIMPTVVFLPPFYTEHVGLGLGVVGTIFMLAKIWDMLTDPIFGYVAERVTTPLGKRRPWIVAATPILMIATYMIFLPSSDIGPGYLVAWLLVFYVGWTMILLSLLAWASELTDDYHQRSRVMGAIQVANLTGTIAVLVIAALSDRATGGDAASRMASMGWTVIVALPVFVAVALWRVPERVPRPGASPDFRATVVAMWRSIALRRLLVCDLIAGLAIGLPSSLVLFFATRTLRLGPESSALVLINAASALVFVPFWIRVAGRVGKDKALLGAALWAIPTGLIYYLLPAESFPLAALAFALGGVNGGALQFLPRAILSDIIDEAEANGGERHEAAYFALLTTTLKAGLALAVGLGLYTLAFIGFDPSGQSTPEAIEGIRYAMIGYPVLFGLAIAGLMYRFPLGREQHERLRAEIGNRRKRSSPAAVHPRR